MAGGAETPNIAALPALARLGTCESARGPDADRHVKLLSQFAVEGALSGAYSHAVLAVAIILAIAVLAWENTTHVPSNPGPSGTPGSTARDQTPPPAAGT